MAFNIMCETCRRPLQVQESYVGKKVRCPACQTIVTVPPPAADPPYAEPPYVSESPPVRRESSPSARVSHQIGYEIRGNDLQMVEIELDPGETVIAEAGAMIYIEENIDYSAKLGDGSTPSQGFFGKLVAAGKRALAGESMFLTHFVNNGRVQRRVAFGAPYPGKIIALDLSQFNHEIVCQKGAFLCGALGTKIGIQFQKKLGVGFFGGEGFILQHLDGDGLVFLHACGTILERDLEDGQILRLESGCLVAMTSTVGFDIQKAGNLTTMLTGGEGIFLATLTGPGRVWVQSLPFSRLADRLAAAIPAAKKD